MNGAGGVQDMRDALRQVENEQRTLVTLLRVPPEGMEEEHAVLCDLALELLGGDALVASVEELLLVSSYLRQLKAMQTIMDALGATPATPSQRTLAEEVAATLLGKEEGTKR